MNNLDDSLRLMSLDQAATILKVSKRTVLRMIQNGHFPAFKLGHQWRISAVKFEKWLEKDH
jgi:excisionase family DNA binding protein